MDKPVGNWNLDGDPEDVEPSAARPRARQAPPGVFPPPSPPPLGAGGMESFDDYGNDSFDTDDPKNRKPEVGMMDSPGPSANNQDDLELMDFSMDKSLMKNTDIHKYAAEAKRNMAPVEERLESSEAKGDARASSQGSHRSQSPAEGPQQKPQAAFAQMPGASNGPDAHMYAQGGGGQFSNGMQQQGSGQFQQQGNGPLQQQGSGQFQQQGSGNFQQQGGGMQQGSGQYQQQGGYGMGYGMGPQGSYPVPPGTGMMGYGMGPQGQYPMPPGTGMSMMGPQGSYGFPPGTGMSGMPGGNMMMGGTMNSMGGAMTGGLDAKSAKEKEEEIERLRDEAKERDKERERLTKQMKAQKRQLEDSLQGTRREAENSHRELKATKQELEDAKQAIMTSNERLRLGESAAMSAAKAADDAAKKQLQQIKEHAEQQAVQARKDKEEAIASMRKEMESLQSEKGKKYRGLMDEVKTERETQLKEMQQELASEHAVRSTKERSLLELKKEVDKLTDELRRGQVSTRDNEDITARLKQEMADLRQKSNVHALEKLELQRAELKQMQTAMTSTGDQVGALKNDLAPLAKRVALMSEEIVAAKTSLQSNAEALVAGVKMEITELERKLGDELENANKKLQQEIKLLRHQIEEQPKSSTCAIC